MIFFHATFFFFRRLSSMLWWILIEFRLDTYDFSTFDQYIYRIGGKLDLKIFLIAHFLLVIKLRKMKRRNLKFRTDLQDPAELFQGHPLPHGATQEIIFSCLKNLWTKSQSSSSKCRPCCVVLAIMCSTVCTFYRREIQTLRACQQGKMRNDMLMQTWSPAYLSAARVLCDIGDCLTSRLSCSSASSATIVWASPLQLMRCSYLLIKHSAHSTHQAKQRRTRAGQAFQPYKSKHSSQYGKYKFPVQPAWVSSLLSDGWLRSSWDFLKGWVAGLLLQVGSALIITYARHHWQTLWILAGQHLLCCCH